MLAELDGQALNIQGDAVISGQKVKIGGTVTVDGSDIVVAQDSFMELPDGTEMQGGIVDLSAKTVRLEDFGTYTDESTGLVVADNAVIKYESDEISVLEGGTASYTDTGGSAVVINGYSGGVGVSCASAGSCTVETEHQAVALADFGQDVDVSFNNAGFMEVSFSADGGRLTLPPGGDVYFSDTDTGSADFMYIGDDGQVLNFDVGKSFDTVVYIQGNQIAINDIRITNNEHHSADGGVSRTLDSSNTLRVYRDSGVNIEGEFDGELVIDHPVEGGAQAVLASGEDVYFSIVDDEIYLGFDSVGEGSRFADATLSYADSSGSISVTPEGSMSMNGRFKVETDDGVVLALGNPGAESSVYSHGDILRDDDGSLVRVDVDTGSAEYVGRVIEGNDVALEFGDGDLRSAIVSDGMCTIDDENGLEMVHAEFSGDLQQIYFAGNLPSEDVMESRASVYFDEQGNYIVGANADRMSIDNGGSIQIVEYGDVRTGKGSGYTSFFVQPEDVMTVFLQDDDTALTAFVGQLEGMDDNQRAVAAEFMGGYQDALLSGSVDDSDDAVSGTYSDVFDMVDDEEFMAAYMALDHSGRDEVVKLAAMEYGVYAEDGYTMADAMVGALADHEFYSSADIDSAWVSNNPIEGRSVAYGSRDALLLGDAVAALDAAGNINDDELAALMFPSDYPEAEAQRVALKYDGVPFSSDTALGLSDPVLSDELEDAVAGVQNMDNFRDTMVEIFGDPDLLSMSNDDIYTMIAADNGWENLPRDQLEKRVDNGLEGRGLFARQVQSSRDEIVLAGGSYGLQQDLDYALEQADEVLPPEPYESGLRAPPELELGTISDVQGIMSAVDGYDTGIVDTRVQENVLIPYFETQVERINGLVGDGDIGDAGMQADALDRMLEIYVFTGEITQDEADRIMGTVHEQATSGFN